MLPVGEKDSKGHVNINTEKHLILVNKARHTFLQIVPMKCIINLFKHFERNPSTTKKTMYRRLGKIITLLQQYRLRRKSKINIMLKCP